MSDCIHDFAGCGCDTPELEHEAREFARFDHDTTVLRELGAWDASQVPCELSDLHLRVVPLTAPTRDAEPPARVPSPSGWHPDRGAACPHRPPCPTRSAPSTPNPQKETSR